MTNNLPGHRAWAWKTIRRILDLYLKIGNYLLVVRDVEISHILCKKRLFGPIEQVPDEAY